MPVEKEHFRKENWKKIPNFRTRSWYSILALSTREERLVLPRNNRS